MSPQNSHLLISTCMALNHCGGWQFGLSFTTNFAFRIPQQLDADTYPDLQDIDRQVALAQTLFPPLMESTRRRDGFQLHFHKILKDLPESKHTACEYLDVILLCITSEKLKRHCLIPLMCPLSRTIYTTPSGEFLDRRRHWNLPSLLSAAN